MINFHQGLAGDDMWDKVSVHQELCLILCVLVNFSSPVHINKGGFLLITQKQECTQSERKRNVPNECD